MNLFLKRRKYSILLLIIAAGYFFLYRQPMPLLRQPSHETLCLFHNITGLPCPVCGTGRGLICLLHLHFKDALLFNPLSYLVFILSVFVFVIVISDSINQTNSADKWMKVRVAFVYQIPFWLLLFANWLWNIHKGM